MFLCKISDLKTKATYGLVFKIRKDQMRKRTILIQVSVFPVGGEARQL